MFVGGGVTGGSGGFDRRNAKPVSMLRILKVSSAAVGVALVCFATAFRGEVPQFDVPHVFNFSYGVLARYVRDPISDRGVETEVRKDDFLLGGRL